MLMPKSFPTLNGPPTSFWDEYYKGALEKWRKLWTHDKECRGQGCGVLLDYDILRINCNLFIWHDMKDRIKRACETRKKGTGK